MSKVKDSVLLQDFERQVSNLLEKGYPALAGKTEKEFLEVLKPLKEKLEGVKEKPETEGKLNFVIVINSNLVPVEKTMPLTNHKSKAGIEKLYPLTPTDFKPVIEIPERQAYLLIDIDRGAETLNVTPEEAFELIRQQRRSPLTIEEGIAIITHYPEFLKKNNCFSLLASRAGDLRVPAIWISEGRPKLGWCWNGNPHTWLGSASCLERIFVTI